MKAIGALRSYFFSKHLSQNDWKITVFTIKGFKYLANDDFLTKLSGVVYKYLPSFDLQIIKGIISKVNKKNRNTTKSTANKKSTSKSKKNFLIKLRNSFPLNIMYEGGFIYIVCGFLYGLYYVKRHNITYLYSTFSPYSNHIIAYLIKSIYKDVVWIADFRDLPFGENDTSIFFQSFQRKMNQCICQKADAITVISSGMKNSLLKYNENIHVVTNGMDADILDFKLQKKTNDKEFTIVYTGILYEGKRDASSLFKSVRALIDLKTIPSNTKLIYAGKDFLLWENWAKEYNLENNIEIKGIVSRTEALLLQKNASINLMLTWATKNEKGIITGKFFEYLSTQNPILCLISGEEDSEIDKIFTTINCGKVYNALNNTEMMNFIEKVYSNNEQYNYNMDELSKYTYPVLTKKLERIFVESNS